MKASAGALMVSGLGIPRTVHAGGTKGLATMIDLDRCDGCPNFDQPRCIASCRDKNLGIIPEPVSPLPKLFPPGQNGRLVKEEGCHQPFDTLQFYLCAAGRRGVPGGEEKGFHSPAVHALQQSRLCHDMSLCCESQI